jgi:hypothetical protein
MTTEDKHKEPLYGLLETYRDKDKWWNPFGSNRMEVVKSQLEKAGIDLLPRDPSWYFLKTATRTYYYDDLVKEDINMADVLGELDTHFLDYLGCLKAKEVRDYETHMFAYPDRFELCLACFYR